MKDGVWRVSPSPGKGQQKLQQVLDTFCRMWAFVLTCRRTGHTAEWQGVTQVRTATCSHSLKSLLCARSVHLLLPLLFRTILECSPLHLAGNDTQTQLAWLVVRRVSIQTQVAYCETLRFSQHSAPRNGKIVVWFPGIKSVVFLSWAFFFSNEVEYA